MVVVKSRLQGANSPSVIENNQQNKCCVFQHGVVSEAE